MLTILPKLHFKSSSRIKQFPFKIESSRVLFNFVYWTLGCCTRHMDFKILIEFIGKAEIRNYEILFFKSFIKNLNL